MAKRKSNQKTNRRNPTPAPKSKNSRRRTRRNNGRRNPFTGLIISGVKSLLSVIPGASALKPLCDVIFSSFGFASTLVENTKDNKPVFSSDAAVYGLSSCTGLSYANILAHSPTVARNVGLGPKIVFDTPFDDARLISIRFELTPQTRIDSRNGKWAAVFIPVRQDVDIQGIPREYRPMTISEVEKLPGSVTASADKKLSLFYRPVAEDGYAYQFNSISALFGYLIVTYSQELRDNWHEFGADSFAPDIIMSGTIKVRQPILGGMSHSYKDLTWNANTGMRLILDEKLVKSGTYGTSITLDPNYTCQKINGICRVSGGRYTYSPDEESVDLCGFEHLQMD